MIEPIISKTMTPICTMVLEKKLELVSEQHSSALLLRQHIHPMTPLVALEADFALSLGQIGGVRSDGRDGQWGVWGGGGA